MKFWFVIVSLVLLGFFGWQLWYVLQIGLKEPAYKVLQKKDGYEIRRYDPYIIAHTALSGSYS
ncbi:heme-binding protein, partial [Candidatus Dependentiae bacterium]